MEIISKTKDLKRKIKLFDDMNKVNKIEVEKGKVKPKFQIIDDFLDLRTIDTNVIIKQLEEKIKMREMSVDKRMKLKLGKE